jgi:hypothetical protein
VLSTLLGAFYFAAPGCELEQAFEAGIGVSERPRHIS